MREGAMLRMLLLFASSLAAALRSPHPHLPPHLPRRGVLPDRRAALLLLPLSLAPLAAHADDKREYRTLDEYNREKAAAKRDDMLYGLFETLRRRASQTGEFDRLAEQEDYKSISSLALAWEATVRKEVIDRATESLEQPAKGQGAALSKSVLVDLKALDKLAKAADGAGVPERSALLRGHVLEFLDLEPERLQARSGVTDL